MRTLRGHSHSRASIRCRQFRALWLIEPNPQIAVHYFVELAFQPAGRRIVSIRPAHAQERGFRKKVIRLRKGLSGKRCYRVHFGLFCLFGLLVYLGPRLNLLEKSKRA